MLIARDRIAEALAEAAFTGQLPALEDEGTGAVERARVVVDFVLDLANPRGAVEALREIVHRAETPCAPHEAPLPYDVAWAEQVAIAKAALDGLGGQ